MHDPGVHAQGVMRGSGRQASAVPVIVVRPEVCFGSRVCRDETGQEC